MKEGPAQPALYIPHGGGPCFFMEWEPRGAWDSLGNWLRSAGGALPKQPEAILVISAHWEEAEFTLTAGPNPSLIYDYYGFPPHTYQLRYPAPGSPALAQKSAALLQAAGIPARLDNARGFDHGMFIPLMLMFPGADIPVVQLSLKAGLDPALHIAAGKALCPLLRENVLLVASGMSFHNLRRFGPDAAAVSSAFDRWLTRTVTAPPNARNEALIHWESAPSARAAHPREEHLLPLMVASGAARDGQPIFSGPVMGMTISAYQFAGDVH